VAAKPKQWDALVRFVDTGNVPDDNNRLEDQIRPIGMVEKTGHLQAAKERDSVPLPP
jgi:Transposase IS66 family